MVPIEMITNIGALVGYVVESLALPSRHELLLRLLAQLHSGDVQEGADDLHLVLFIVVLALDDVEAIVRLRELEFDREAGRQQVEHALGEAHELALQMNLARPVDISDLLSLVGRADDFMIVEPRLVQVLLHLARHDALL